MYKYLLTGLLSVSLAAPLLAAEEVNLYSARKEKLIAPLLEKFTESTGIEVNLVTGKADALLKRLETEGKNSPADMLITTDAGRLHRARSAGLLQPVKSEILASAIPAHLRDADNYWFGLSMRARPIMYATDRVKPEQLSSYEDLAGDQWKGKICIRSSNNIYNQSLVASMLASQGDKKTQNWTNALVKNLARKPQGGDRDQIKAAAAGICDIAIANTYYLGAMINGKDEKQKAAASKVAVFWPNQSDRGAHVNVSGAAITSAAKNAANAQKLLEFLVSDKAQQWYAEANHEYPVKAGVKPSETLQAWGDFKGDTLNLTELGQRNAEAVKIMDRAGWR